MRNLRIELLSALCVLLLFSAFTLEQKEAVTIFMIGDSTMANRNPKDGNQECGCGQGDGFLNPYGGTIRISY